MTMTRTEMTVKTTACPWCLNGEQTTDEQVEEGATNGTLCRPHLADYEGLTVAELDRSEDEEAADLL